MKINCLLLFSVISSFNLFGQNSFRNNHQFINRQISLNFPDASVRFNFMEGEKAKKVKAKEELFYFWFKANTIHSTQGGFDGKLLHGEFTKFYINYQLQEKGRFKRGLKNGKWIYWYENGNIHKTEPWKKGMKNGIEEFYDENGNLQTVIKYKNNLVHGVSKVYRKDQTSEIKNYKKGKEVIPKIKKEKDTATIKDKSKKKKEGEETVNEIKENKDGNFIKTFFKHDKEGESKKVKDDQESKKVDKNEKEIKKSKNKKDKTNSLKEPVKNVKKSENKETAIPKDKAKGKK